MMKSNYFLLLVLILALSACKKEESTSLWNISGNVVMQDSQIPDITTPLEGINVYLLKAPFTMDTITHWYTKTDILDSTLTDANGFYTFSQIQVGDYTVMPTDTSAGYRFKWSENSDAILLSAGNTQTNYTINFTTQEPIVENSGGTGTFTDPRDNQTYTTIEIGDQIWMAENLKYLPAVVGVDTKSYTEPYYYVYDYNGTDVATAKATDNYATYGVLYNWPAACASCPSGWHLPSNSEWTGLENYLINNGYAFNIYDSRRRNRLGKSMAATSGWKTYSLVGTVGNDQASNNSSGFTALPGGYRYYYGSFYFLGYSSDWWSSSEYTSYAAMGRGLSYLSRDLYMGAHYKEDGFSVRCIKD